VHPIAARSHAVAAPKKPAAKALAKTPPAIKKPATAVKSTAHAAPAKSASAEAGQPAKGQPAKVSNEAFWVHPPKKGAAAADQGSDTNVKYHPPQVVHP
jgi:hypothetical protein